MSLLGRAAYHTEENVLSPATYQKFANEVRNRWRRGAHASAMGLWVSVVETQHNPPTMGREAELSVRVAPCTEMPCQRCDQRRGGFHFPFVGHYTSADAVVPDTMSQRPGAIIMSIVGRPWWMQKSTSSGVACTQKMVCRSRRTGLFRPLCAKSIPRRPLPNISGAHGVNGTLGAGLGWSQAGHLPQETARVDRAARAGRMPWP